jgi:pyruvate dehydrogenase E2 component (dihydrolipoamide acetyltransferase)
MTITALTMPKWGLTMTEGTVVRWLRQPGAAFAPGDEILEIETSKIANVLEAETTGTLARIVAPEGAILPIGALLAVIAPSDTPATEIDAFVAGFEVPAPSGEADAEAETVATRNLEAGGRRLRYLELGSGADAPVLLLHGFGADLNSWMFTQPALADGRRTIALDLPGHGGSAKDVGDGGAEAMVEAVDQAMTTLGLQRVHLVGHSMGGAIAALLAARRPDRVSSLTLIAPVGFGPAINTGFIDGFVRTTRRRDAQDVLNLLVHDKALISRSMVEDVLRYKRLDGATAALQSIARAWFANGRQSINVVAEVAAMAMPLQVIWGCDDQIIPASHADALGPHRPVHRLEAAGHLPHMEKASEVNRLIRRFIAA